MKTLKIAAMAAGVLLLAGCGNEVAQNNSTETGADNTSAPQAAEPSALSGVITSIADAMASGKAMQCTYTMTDEDGGESSVMTYVDGKKYMTTLEVAGKTQKMIFDGEAMYSWSDGQKTGMKMTTACSEELAANAPKGQIETVDPADAEKTFDGATNVKCEPNDSADFTVPTDVIFTDQCEMMKNVMKNIPSGVNIPNMPKDIPNNVPPAMPGVQGE